MTKFPNPSALLANLRHVVTTFPFTTASLAILGFVLGVLAAHYGT